MISPAATNSPLLLFACLAITVSCQRPAHTTAPAVQHADTGFQPTVARPAYRSNGPLILIDASHSNFHTAEGRYKPFAELLRNDGYVVRDNKEGFDAGFAGASVFVIANARGKNEMSDSAAFTPSEIAAVHQFVENGGSLLLVVDHYPFGQAARELGAAFGVSITGGMVEDSVSYDSSSTDRSQLVFSRSNRLLGNHPITNGRNSSERLNRVVSFTGTTLAGPPEAVQLLRLSTTALAYKAFPRLEKVGENTRVHVGYGNPTPAAGHAQGLAFTVGKGRVVVLGEAGMLTAQIDPTGQAFGMGVPGTDDKQFVLNIAHWLAHLLQ
ncbi:MAG TPA: hypothetical protein VM099_06570 [Gemmatimonadaceae bacterium]|nr:hypothetical protein [Gemmatimonadaceae bacterium]